MKKNIFKIALACVLGFSSAYAAGGMEINLNNDAVELQINTNLNQYYELDNANDYYINVGILHEDTDAPNLFNLSLQANTSEFDAQDIEFGLGLGVVASSKDSNSFLAIPLQINALSHINDKVIVELQGAYSPSVLSFSKADKYSSFKASVGYQLLNNGYVFLGIRNTKTTYTNNIGQIKYNDDIFIGYKIKF